MQAEREMQEGTPQPLPVDTLWVRFVFVDHGGIRKTKAVHRDGFEKRARAGVGLAKGCWRSTQRDAAPRVGVEPRGGVPPRPRPLDPHPAPFARGQVIVACDMTEPDATTPLGRMPAQRSQTGPGAARREGGAGPSPPTRPSSTCGVQTARWTGRLTPRASP